MKNIIRRAIALCGGMVLLGLCVPCSHAYDFFLSPADTDNYAGVEILEIVTPYGPSEDRVQSFTNGVAEAPARISFQETAAGSWATHEHGAGYTVQNGFFTDPQGKVWSRAELDMHSDSEGQLSSMGCIDVSGFSYTDYLLQIVGSSDPVEVLLTIDSSNTFFSGNQYITIRDGEGQVVFSWNDESGYVPIQQASVLLSPEFSYLIDATSDHDFTLLSQDSFLYGSSFTLTLEMGEPPSVPVPLPGSALMLGCGLVTLLVGVGRKRTAFHK